MEKLNRRAQIAKQAVICLKEIQEKILESTGTDDDMQPITLKDILAAETK